MREPNDLGVLAEDGVRPEAILRVCHGALEDTSPARFAV